MKKALVYAPFDLRVAEVECPRPGPNQVLIRVVASSPYGTDFKFYDGTLAPAPYPLGFGGDFAGEVVEVGAAVENVAVGDRVSASGTQHCERCRMCRTGRENLCLDNPNPSQSFGQGFSEYAVLDANRVHRLPENVSWEAGAMVGAINLALLTFSRLRPLVGDTVLQLGGGAMGWGSIQVGKLAGCTMIVVEPTPLRRELCKRFGADYVWDPGEVDLRHELDRVAPDGGPDHVIESAGTEVTHRLAVELAGIGGNLALVAANQLSLSSYGMFFKELTVLAVRGVRHQKEALDLISRGKVDMTPAITHRVSFDDFPEIFRQLREHPEQFGRVIVYQGGGAA